MAFEFLKTALKDYRVAALTPSSHYVVTGIMRMLPPDARCVVEYGAGDGVITRAILAALGREGKVIAVELNKAFAAALSRIDDPRLTVINEDVAAVSQRLNKLGALPIDAVISGIPFSYLNRTVREEIVASTHKAITRGGRFIVDQHSLFLVPLLKRYFSSVQWRFEPRNFPPHFTMMAEK